MMEKCPHCGSDKDDDWYHGTDCCRDCYHEKMSEKAVERMAEIKKRQTEELRQAKIGYEAVQAQSEFDQLVKLRVERHGETLESACSWASEKQLQLEASK